MADSWSKYFRHSKFTRHNPLTSWTHACFCELPIWLTPIKIYSDHFLTAQPFLRMTLSKSCSFTLGPSLTKRSSFHPCRSRHRGQTYLLQMRRRDCDELSRSYFLCQFMFTNTSKCFNDYFISGGSDQTKLRSHIYLFSNLLVTSIVYFG